MGFEARARSDKNRSSLLVVLGVCVLRRARVPIKIEVRFGRFWVGVRLRFFGFGFRVSFFGFGWLVQLFGFKVRGSGVNVIPYGTHMYKAIGSVQFVHKCSQMFTNVHKICSQMFTNVHKCAQNIYKLCTKHRKRFVRNAICAPKMFTNVHKCSQNVHKCSQNVIPYGTHMYKGLRFRFRV